MTPFRTRGVTKLGKLTTHVLDLVHGCPGRNIHISLFSLNAERTLIASDRTNADGRLEKPLMEAETMNAGCFELVFQVREYFDAMGIDEGANPFLDEVVIRFGIQNADEHYHVPLLLSRFGYSTYRGS